MLMSGINDDVASNFKNTDKYPTNAIMLVRYEDASKKPIKYES